MNGVTSLKTLRSKSVLGLSSVVLIFQENVDLMQARQLVQERLALAAGNLPAVATPPVILSPLSSTSRVLKIGVSSETLSQMEMTTLARWTIRPRLMAIPGVANVAIWGQRDRQFQVLVDPERLRQHNVTLDDIVRELNAVAPHDWGGFLTQRTGEAGRPSPTAGLVAGGYRLSYAEEPTPYQRDTEKRAGEVNLTWSLGLVMGKAGQVNQVIWDGPAFDSGLTVAAEIIAVNGRVYSDTALRDVVAAAKGGREPIRLIVKTGSRVREVAVPYFGGYRYPRLEKVGAGEGSLDRLLAAR